MKFVEMATTKKGGIGEAIILEMLRRRGYVVYPAPDEDRGHLVDFFTYNPKEGTAALIEVKTYPRRAFHQDTGIDEADLWKYSRQCLPVILFFVDEVEECIYCARLEDLAPYATLEGGKAYFPLHLFRVVRRLTPAELARIRKHPTQVAYRNVKRFFTAQGEARPK